MSVEEALWSAVALLAEAAFWSVLVLVEGAAVVLEAAAF